MTQEQQQGPLIFGIRHLSPAGAFYLKKTLDECSPEYILIEGPSDFTPLLHEFANPEIALPAAIMSYTKELPIRTILYPFAEYSPEYQAILWAVQHKKECRFIDLPSGTFLSLEARQQKITEANHKDAEDTQNKDNKLTEFYKQLEEEYGADGHETFWEYCVEHCGDQETYRKAAITYGEKLRILEMGQRDQNAILENTLREAYMRLQMELAKQEARQRGIPEEKIIVITGAYHVAGLLGQTAPMTQEEAEALPRLENMLTLMPYSYYRLSSHSGYGAGNKAPSYYETLWQALQKKDMGFAAFHYLSEIATEHRKNGGIVSSAEVIEAVRLSLALANLHGYASPTLKDLRDAATTCMGHGNFGEIATAVAKTEIGTKIGYLPDGMSKTSIQSDFYHLLEELKLEKFRSVTAQDLRLDLREKLQVKNTKLAKTDLYRSFFLHRLKILSIDFATIGASTQENATWAENWVLRWTPETEIQLVESVLKGETVEKAAAFVLKERVEKSEKISDIAEMIHEAFNCGMPESADYAVRMLQSLATEEATIEEISKAMKELSFLLQYGDIRGLDREPLKPLLEQLFLRACLVMAESCICNDAAATHVLQAIDEINTCVINHDFLSQTRLLTILTEIADRDDLNTKLSGFCAAILLERGCMDQEELKKEVVRRLSPGIPAELGAGWFEGLSVKNHYALIARLGLWENLSNYIELLDEEEFKRALVFLRRAFSDFSARERGDIAENLGEIWNINPLQVSEKTTSVLSGEEQDMVNGLDDFDFDDF